MKTVTEEVIDFIHDSKTLYIALFKKDMLKNINKQIRVVSYNKSGTEKGKLSQEMIYK
jgi:hypothetical protein